SIKPELALEYRRATMAGQTDITPDNFTQKLVQFAKAHDLDVEKMMAGMKDASIAAAVGKDFREDVARGVGETPTVLLNGEPFIESFTLKDIAASLDKDTKSK